MEALAAGRIVVEGGEPQGSLIAVTLQIDGGLSAALAEGLRAYDGAQPVVADIGGKHLGGGGGIAVDQNREMQISVLTDVLHGQLL